MKDTIYRQAAIDVVFSEPLYESGMKKRGADAVVPVIYEKIKSLPSAQLERKKGKWIERNPQNSDSCRLIECDQCGFSHIVGFNVPYEHWIENRNFCERCGADMKGEQDDSI